MNMGNFFLYPETFDLPRNYACTKLKCGCTGAPDASIINLSQYLAFFFVFDNGILKFEHSEQPTLFETLAFWTTGKFALIL